MRNPLLSHPPPATSTWVALANHPLHPMMVNFPVAFLLGGGASDIAFWWTGDPFWARGSLWLIGVGLFIGSGAALAGFLEFLFIEEIRRHVTSWSHFLAAVMLLAVAAANWWLRFADPVAALLPWGLFLSLVTAASVSFAAWLGGNLVFEYNVGTAEEEEEKEDQNGLPTTRATTPIINKAGTNGKAR
jgi:uncharacterized membrane protein